MQSLEQRILRNTAGFFQSLIDCPSPEVAVLARISARDIRSSLGKNLQRIRDLTQLDPWAATKAELHAALERGLNIETPKADIWRPRCLANLLAERSLLPCRWPRSLSFNLAHWITGGKLGLWRGTHDDRHCLQPAIYPLFYIHGPVAVILHNCV